MDKDKSLVGNDQIEENIQELKNNLTDENLARVLTTIRKRALDGGQFVVSVTASGSDVSFSMRTANFNGKKWFVAFTSFDEELKGDTAVMSGFLADIGKLLDMTLKSPEVEGILINPYGNMLTLNKELIQVVKGV